MHDPRNITLGVGAVSGAAVAGLCAIYAAALVIGLITLPAPDAQIGDPWFTLLELLILVIAPSLVILSISLMVWTPDNRRVPAVIAVVFLSMCAITTMAVHTVVLVASRNPIFSDPNIMRAFLSFQWPSVVYVLDILAWDVFFPMGSLAAAIAIPPAAKMPVVRILLASSSVLAFAGLAGVPLGDMRLRNIGILGYAFLFPIAAWLIAVAFLRELQTRVAQQSHAAIREG